MLAVCRGAWQVIVSNRHLRFVNFTSSFVAGALLALLLQLFLVNGSAAYAPSVSPAGSNFSGFLFESLRSVVVGLAAFILGGFVVGAIAPGPRRAGWGYVSGVAAAELGIVIASVDETESALAFAGVLLATVSISVCVSAFGVLFGREKRHLSRNLFSRLGYRTSRRDEESGGRQ
jgi:hypothetical protein